MLLLNGRTLTQQHFVIIHLLLLCGYTQKLLFNCDLDNWTKTSKIDFLWQVLPTLLSDLPRSAVQVKLFNSVECANLHLSHTVSPAL